MRKTVEFYHTQSEKILKKDYLISEGGFPRVIASFPR
jgi:hypothetical protein